MATVTTKMAMKTAPKQERPKLAAIFVRLPVAEKARFHRLAVADGRTDNAECVVAIREFIAARRLQKKAVRDA